MTPEGKVKHRVKALLDKYAAYYFFPVSGGYGKSGVPDIIGCYRGYFFAIECKAGKGKTTLLQDMQLDKIRKAGGIAIVVNEHNLEDVESALKNIEVTQCR